MKYGKMKKFNKIEDLVYFDYLTLAIKEVVKMRVFYEVDEKNRVYKVREYQLSLEEQGLIDKESFKWTKMN